MLIELGEEVLGLAKAQEFEHFSTAGHLKGAVDKRVAQGPSPSLLLRFLILFFMSIQTEVFNMLLNELTMSICFSLIGGWFLILFFIFILLLFLLVFGLIRILLLLLVTWYLIVNT